MSESSARSVVLIGYLVLSGLREDPQEGREHPALARHAHLAGQARAALVLDYRRTSLKKLTPTSMVGSSQENKRRACVHEAGHAVLSIKSEARFPVNALVARWPVGQLADSKESCWSAEFCAL